MHIKKLKIGFILFIFFLSFSSYCSEQDNESLIYEEKEENLKILLPQKLYAVQDMPLEIFFDNLILSHDSEKYKYEISLNDKKVGQSYRRKWVFHPLKENIGKNSLEIKIINPKTNEIKSSLITQLYVSAKSKKNNLNILSIGDSLGHQSRFPSRLFDIFKQRGEEKNIKFLGSHFPEGSLVQHENYGGWTWERFLTFYQPGKAYIYHADKSPFVFIDSQTGILKVNFAKYIEKSLKNEKPDIIIILLGINDAWPLDPDNQEELEKGLTLISNNAHKLINNITAVLPNVSIGIGLVIPANNSKRSFEDIYKDRTNPWRWKRVSYTLNSLYLKTFTNNKNVTIIPTNLGVDNIDHYNSHEFIPDKVNYSVSHVVHPNQEGDLAIARSFYYWIEYIKYKSSLNK